MEINDLVFVTFTNDFGEVHSTHVVLKEKLDDFVNDTHVTFGVSSAHVNKAVMNLNCSIGKGDYIKSINIFN